MNEQEIIDHENLTIANEIAWKNYKLEKEKTEKTEVAKKGKRGSKTEGAEGEEVADKKVTYLGPTPKPEGLLFNPPKLVSNTPSGVNCAIQLPTVSAGAPTNTMSPVAVTCISVTCF